MTARERKPWPVLAKGAVRAEHTTDATARVPELEAEITRLSGQIVEREKEVEWWRNYVAEQVRLQKQQERVAELERGTQMTAADEKMCQTCLWWARSTEVGGECRFHAPVQLSDGRLSHGGWPKTHPTDWCGDYEEKEAE